MTRDFITGVILGVVIALMWRNLQRPIPTPPDRNSTVIDMRSELQRTGT